MKMNSILETGAADCHPASVPDYTPVAELRKLQLQRLQAVVTRAWQQVKPFRARMDELGLKPEEIRSLDDIVRLPFTVKCDLRDNLPVRTFCQPHEGRCPSPRLQRNHRQTHCGRVYQGRRGRMDLGAGPLL